MRLFSRIILFLGTTVFAGIIWKTFQKEVITGNDQARMDGRVSYNFDIRPILSDKCFACHGPDANKREAGLRLDDPESAYKVLTENPGAHAIVPGKPELSMVYQLISTSDTNMRMPPFSSNLNLTE